MRTYPLRYFFQFRMILIFAILVLFVTCSPTPPRGQEPSPPGSTPQSPWDFDGDDISDAVEENNANGHLGFDPFDPDANPSRARGLPWDGELDGGINLPNQGSGYYHFLGTDQIDRDDWGTLALLNMIEKAGRAWKKNHPGLRFGVGDLCLQNGGPFPPHVSHQNGIDIDIRYVRNDGQEAPLDLSGPDSVFYDASATADLINELIKASGNKVTHIFIDTKLAKLSGAMLVHDAGHRNHLHVRIKDPDGTNN